MSNPLPPFSGCYFTELACHLDPLLKGNGQVCQVCIASPIPLNNAAATHPALWTSCLSRDWNTRYVRGLFPFLEGIQNAGSSGPAGTSLTICWKILKTSTETCCQSEARVRMTKNPRVGSANGVAVSMATTPGTRMFHVASPQLLILWDKILQYVGTCPCWD